MKQYQYNEYGGKWDYTKEYRGKERQKTQTSQKKITYPWKNHQKMIHYT